MLATEKPQTMIQLMAAYGLTLPSNAIEWRIQWDEVAKLPPRGKLKPLFAKVYCLATDGVVAWFLLADRATLFHGHLGNFERERAETTSRQPAAKASKPLLSAKAKALAEID